jgi:hypothetical protein
MFTPTKLNNSNNIRWGVKKFPEWWYCTVILGHGNAYLMTFKLGFLCTQCTLAPLILPLLEAQAEVFFWNLPKFRRSIPFDALYGCETCSFEAHFYIREELIVTRSEIRGVRWFDYDRVGFLCEEFLNNKWLVDRCVIMIQKTLSLLLFAPLNTNCISQLFKTCM